MFAKREQRTPNGKVVDRSHPRGTSTQKLSAAHRRPASTDVSLHNLQGLGCSLLVSSWPLSRDAHAYVS
jgi:hypothetical protein